MFWVPLCGEVVTGKEIERNLDFDDGVVTGRLDESQIGKVAPRLILEILDRAEKHEGPMLAFKKNSPKNVTFLLKLPSASFCKNWIITLVFEEERQFFSPKVGKNSRY
jgi:hypothetical protein